MFHDIAGLLEMAVCCAKPPYALKLNAQKRKMVNVKARKVNRGLLALLFLHLSELALGGKKFLHL
jgi:hypothetical protein